MGPLHTYNIAVTWTGAGKTGTSSYTAYSRDNEITAEGKPPLPGSADVAFRGDPTRYNPEELLVAALSQCHMLWFLHLAAQEGVTVTHYLDHAMGTMRVEAVGAGQFTHVVLRPQITVRQAPDHPIDDQHLAVLHARAGEHCFIKRSVNFPVRVDPAPLTAEIA
ncbi:OsmC family protein [Actinotalea sp. K2]|uniref:OsmC family protein n=1 Tax=Actinotalea sp. K2 TaxID=2939438 RepID=UPI00201780D0|nr:OsmC family protein [Actinotalea sp. K2]MCL3862018.1 OsmC family protein [Actinotalea sp. K2]